MCYYGGSSPQLSGFEIVRIPGKLVFPESREYELIFHGQSNDDVTTQTCFMWLDGIERVALTFNSKEIVSSYPVVYMEEGEYDFVIECKGDAHQLSFRLDWNYPVSSEFSIIGSPHIRGIVPDPVMKIVTLVPPCRPGTFFSVGLRGCLKCPRGTCQPNTGEFHCIPCSGDL